MKQIVWYFYDQNECACSIRARNYLLECLRFPPLWQFGSLRNSLINQKSFVKFAVLHCTRDNIYISKLPELRENVTDTTKEGSATRRAEPATPSCQVKWNLWKLFETFARRVRPRQCWIALQNLPTWFAVSITRDNISLQWLANAQFCQLFIKLKQRL